MVTVYFAQKAFVLHEGCLLAVRRNAEDQHHPLKWEVPGGRLEAGEDLDAHLAREVLEEAGVRVRPGEPFYVWKWNIKPRPNEPQTIVAVARICYALTSELSALGRVDGDDLDLMQWIPVLRIRDYDWIPNMIPVIDAFLIRSETSQAVDPGSCT